MDKVLALLPKKTLIVMLAALSYLTSPAVAMRMLWLMLCKTPYYIAKRCIENILPSLMMKDVSSDTALITGAASGIGKLLALKFARLGAKVVLLDVNAAAVEQRRVRSPRKLQVGSPSAFPTL
jgi:NADPH:quinone reductase-like Zn-dependent oxidoreductase